MLEITFLPPAERSRLAPLFIEMQSHYGIAIPTSADIEAALATWSNGVEIIAAIEENEIIGFAGFSTLAPASLLKTQLFLKELYVAAPARQRGVGQALMHFLARQAVERGIARIDWTTAIDNHGARALYERIGARILSEKIIYRLERQALKEFARSPAGHPGGRVD